jgi:DNA-directed RNA polymerase specialized sigma24 family protein
MGKIEPRELRIIFDRGYVTNNDEKILSNVCEMVYKSHFAQAFSDKGDDLIQEGLLGLIRLVSENNFDETKGDILTFAYSRVRNSMSNYLYAEQKYNNPATPNKPVQYFDNVDYGNKSNSDVKNDIFSKSKNAPYIEEEKVGEIRNHVRSMIQTLGIEGDLAYCVETYFNDKLGIKCILKQPTDYSIDFIDKYRFYVNTIEYDVIMKFLGSRAFDNKIQDIVDVLEAEGDIDFYMRMFIDSLSDKQMEKLMYVFSMNDFKFPSKYKILKVDEYVSIYKRIKHGASVEDISKSFDKPSVTVKAIFDKFDLIFS